MVFWKDHLFVNLINIYIKMNDNYHQVVYEEVL